MDQNTFFNVATKGTIRSAVAEFMENNSYLNKLCGKRYYDIEDAICWFIEDHMYEISNFVNREEVKDRFDAFLPEDCSLSDDAKEIFVDEFYSKYIEANDDQSMAFVAEVVNEHPEILSAFDLKSLDDTSLEDIQ